MYQDKWQLPYPMVSEPTRDNSVLDLFLTNNPTLVDNVSTEPGISDHETVIAVVKLRPTIQNMKLRAVHIYSKALWESVIVLCFVVRYFMSILVLQSSWWGRESLLLCLICLPGTSWWWSGSSSRWHGIVCGLWLWYFLIILTYYLWGMICRNFSHYNYLHVKVKAQRNYGRSLKVTLTKLLISMYPPKP